MATVSRDEFLEKGRHACTRRSWNDAYRMLSEAQQMAALDADDLALLADAAWWLGRVDESLACFRSAFRLCVDAQAHRPASLLAITIGATLMLRNEIAQGSAWLARAERLFISPRTVSRHLENIFAKLSVSTRSAAAAWASAHHLHPVSDGVNDPPAHPAEWVE
jgi:hypothetical protein